MGESVLALLRGIAGKTSHPCWLYGVPVLHFLKEKCKPYEEASGKTNHDSYKPEWWGTVEFGKDIDYFKSKTSPWVMYVDI